MKIIRLIRHAESSANAGFATTVPASIPLTEEGHRQARAFADSITSTPDLIISSPFERAVATALPTAERFPQIPYKQWPIEEFTYLSPNRFAGTTQADRKTFVESYWENGDAEMIDGPGAESFSHLLGRADAMVARLADHDAQEILVFSHGQFIRATAWLIKYREQPGSPDSMRGFRAADVREPFRNCSSYQLEYSDSRWTVECLTNTDGKERFIDDFCTKELLA